MKPCWWASMMTGLSCSIPRWPAAMAGGARIRAVFHPILDIDGRAHQRHRAGLRQPGRRGTRKSCSHSLREAFAQGAVAVRDWKAMLARLAAARADLDRHPPRLAGAAKPTSAKISPSWIGWRTIISPSWARATMCWPRMAPTACWSRSRAAAWASCPTMTRGWCGAKGGERGGLSAEVRAFLDSPDPLIVTKSATRSLVHRRAHMDYIGIKTFDAGRRLCRRAPLCRPVHLQRLSRPGAHHSAAAPQDRRGDGRRPAWRRPAMTARPSPISWTPSRATSCSRSRPTNFM